MSLVITPPLSSLTISKLFARFPCSKRLDKNPPPLTNWPQSDSDSNDSVIEVYSSLKESKTCSKREYINGDSEPSSSKLKKISDQSHNKEAPMIRVKQYIRENLSLNVDQTRQASEPVRETSETDPRLSNVLRESVSTNNSDGRERNNETESTGDEMCVYLKLLFTTKRKHSRPPYVLDCNKSSKWPRVVMRKLDLNSFKYAREISDTCLLFIHRRGRNNAIRSSKNQRTQPIASTSHDRNSPKSMTLRSRTIKKEVQDEDSTKASTSSLSTNAKVDDQKIKETAPVKRPRGRPRKIQRSPISARKEGKKKPEKRLGSPIIAPNGGKKRQESSTIAPEEEKKRPVRRPKRSSNKSLTETAKYNPKESETVHPISQSPEVDEYYKYNKKRRALSKSDQNNSQNFARQTRSSKTNTNTDLAKDHGQSILDTEDSFGNFTDDVKRNKNVQSLENPCNELTIEDKGSHMHQLKRNNMKTVEHVQTDPNPINQFPNTVKDEESPAIQVDNNNVNLGANVQTNETVKDESSQEFSMEYGGTGDNDNEDSRSVICIEDEESVETCEEGNKATAGDVETDEESHEHNAEDDNANNEDNRDDDSRSVIYIDDEESVDNRAIIRKELTDEETQSESSLKDEESQEHSPESDNLNSGDDAQAHERLQVTVKKEKSPEQWTKNDDASTTEGDGDEDNQSVIYIEDEETWEPEETGDREGDNAPENQNEPEDEEDSVPEDQDEPKDEEEDTVAESQNEQQIREQIKQKPGPGPIELIDISSDETEHYIPFIDLEAEDKSESTWETNLTVKEEDEVNSNPSSGQVVPYQAASTVAHERGVEAEMESGESQSRSAFADDPEEESDSKFECEGGSEHEDEIQNDPEESYYSDKEDLSEGEQMEAELSSLGQIVAMEVRGQQLTSSHVDPDSTTNSSVVAAAKPQSERQNWRAGPLKAQIRKSKVLFECGVEDCPFTTRLYYLFESHIATNHSTAVWTGECDGCTSQMNVDEPFSLIVALKHLVLHIKQSKNNNGSSLLEYGHQNVDKPEAYKTKVTKSLKKSKISDPSHYSLKSSLSTVNNPNNEESEEENVSTNNEEEEEQEEEQEEEENTSYSTESDTNGDENLNFRVQDVPAVISEQACDTNCNGIGSVMKTHIQECHVNVVHTPVWNNFNPPPVIAPVIPIEVHTPVWDGFSPPPLLTPAVPYELNTPVWEGFRSPPVVTFFVPSGIPTPVISGFNSPFVFESSQPLEAQTPLGGDFNPVCIPTATIQPNAQTPAVDDFSSPPVFETSQTSPTISQNSTASVYVPAISSLPGSPTPAIASSSIDYVYRDSQTPEFQISVRRSTDSVSIPNTSDPSRSQSPATGGSNSPIFVERSQSSRSQSPVRDCANFVYDPTTSNSPPSPTLGSSGSNPPFADRSSQTSVSQSPVRKNSDFVSTPVTFDPLRSDTPGTVSSNSSISLEFSHSSASETPIRGPTDFVFIPIAPNPSRSQTPSKSGFNFPADDRSSQPSASQSVLRNSIHSASVPITSNSPRSQSPAIGFPNSPVFVESSQSSRSQSPVRNKISTVSIPTASNSSRSPIPDSDSFSSADFFEGEPSTSQAPVKDCTNSDLIPTASNPSRTSTPGPDSSNSDVFFESTCPSDFQIPKLNSQPGTVSTSSSTQSQRDNVRSTPSYSLTVILDKSCNQQFTPSPERQEILKKKMHSLGHIISEEGVRPNPKSLQAIRNFSTPSNHAEVRDFLRLVRYCRRFVKGFVEISKPLITLSKQKDVPFVWNEAEQKSFSELKRIFVTEPILHFPDFNEKFILTVESCYYALSYVLSQGEIENGRVIAYGSRKLTDNEEKFSATEKELLGIVWGVKHFEPYLQKQSFVIVTSHEPLTWLMTCEDLGGKMAKFRQQLLQYNFKLVYCDKKRPSGPSGASQTVSQCNTSRAPKPFGKFVKFHYTALNLPKLETVITNQTSHTPFVLFFSKDLSNYNPLSHYIRSNFNFNDVREPDNLYDVIELTKPEQTIYLCICRHFHFERLRYQDISCSLEGLRNLLDTKDYSGKIFIHDVTKKYRDIDKNMFSELVAYAFKDSKVKAVLLQLKKITPTDAEKRKVLEDYHRTKRDEHSGFRTTYARIKEKYRWKSMKSDIFNYIRHCRTCQDKDTDSEIVKFSKSAFKKLNVNVIGPLPKSENGCAYILTVQDLQTKYSYSIALPDIEFQTVCAEFRKFINVHGPPKIISSELGTEFADRLIKDGSQNMDMGRPKYSPLTSQDNLLSLSLRYRLMMFVLHYKYDNWDVVLPLAVFILNFRYQGSAAYMLFEKLLKLANGSAVTN